MSIVKIFNKDFIDSLPDWDAFNNPSVVVLCGRDNAALNEFRSQIESWFQNIPESEQADMYSRLRSLNDEQHLSAFYELMLHQYCLEEGWQIEKHPLIKGKKPDFFISINGKYKFILEVSTLLDDRDLRNKQDRYYQLLRKINGIRTKFKLSVAPKDWPFNSVDNDEITREIENWLATIRTKDNTLCELQIDEIGFKGTIEAVYSSDTRGNTIRSFLLPDLIGDPFVKKIKNRISNKSKNYKALKGIGIPFVLALCSGSKWLFDEWPVENALYGRFRATWNPIDPEAETKWERDHSGLITPKPGLLGDTRYKRFSSILFCEREYTRDEVLYGISMFHNPWADVEMPVEIFSKVRQFAVVERQSGKVRLDWLDDGKHYIVFK